MPVRMLVPNLITLLALCAGLTAIRLSIEGRMELALGAIVFAAMLDGIDGRVARLIKGQSRFGAELDSLADFVNFGVAPALILYFWQLKELNNGGWIAAMVFAISGGLRLARFNAALDDPDKPAFAANFFTGVPAPAGAICVLLPIYLAFLGVPVVPGDRDRGLYARHRIPDGVAAAGVLRQDDRPRVPPEMVLPAFVFVVLFIALLIGYPWYVLTVGTLLSCLAARLASLSYRRAAAALARRASRGSSRICAAGVVRAVPAAGRRRGRRSPAAPALSCAAPIAYG